MFDLIALLGLMLAGWGHCILNDVARAEAAWARLDGLFPAAWRSSASVAGSVLIMQGALFVLIAFAR